MTSTTQARPARLTTEQLLEGLNPPQREAVLHEGGPVLVVAGAGSGKTRVLTRQICYLVSQRRVRGSILAITFTNKAAAEMRGRVMDLVGNRAKLMWVSTFLHVCSHSAIGDRPVQYRPNVLDLRRCRLQAADAACGPRS